MQGSSLVRSPRTRGLSRTPPCVAAFFDMDKTLIAENSGSVYMRHLYEKGEIDSWQLASGMLAYLRYKLGVLDLHTWARGLMLEYKGRSEADLAAEALELFEDELVHLIYPEAEALVKEHLSHGHVVAIVSGSTRFVVGPLAQHLGVDHILYTDLEVEDGCFTGRVIEPICFEDGKIYWLQQFIEDQNIDLARSYFYTDSVTDLPLLELVGHPVVVNPDPVLYRSAVRRHWPVRFFTPPGESRRSAAGGRAKAPLESTG